MFVELKAYQYVNGRHYTENILFDVDDITRVVPCIDDSSYTNIITTDGEVHTILGRYQDVSKKVIEADNR